jgi:hypothetical protein
VTGPDERLAEPETHRGGFGEFGGETSAFIERTFRERIVLVGVSRPPYDDEAVEASLDELELLVDTAGADVVGRVVQRRQAPDPATYIGSGKAEAVRELAEATDCDTVVFDDELSPAQQYNLEKLLGRTAIDRTAVILDIFAQNASSQEGKAQVQLALFRYRLPRLRGRGITLSQQAGGIGARVAVPLHHVGGRHGAAAGDRGGHRAARERGRRRPAEPHPAARGVEQHHPDTGEEHDRDHAGRQPERQPGRVDAADLGDGLLELGPFGDDEPDQADEGEDADDDVESPRAAAGVPVVHDSLLPDRWSLTRVICHDSN